VRAVRADVVLAGRSAWSWALSKVNEALNVCAPATYSFSCSMVPGFKCSIGRTHPQIHFSSLSRSHFNCRAHTTDTPTKFTVILENSPTIEFSSLAAVCWRHCSVYLQQSQLWRLGCGKFMQSYALAGGGEGLVQRSPSVSASCNIPNMLHVPHQPPTSRIVSFCMRPNQIFHFKCYLFYCRLPDSKSRFPLPFAQQKVSGRYFGSFGFGPPQQI